MLMPLHACAEGARQVTENGQTYYVNPSQANVSGCTDVPPDDRYNCTQQVRQFPECHG